MILCDQTYQFGFRDMPKCVAGSRVLIVGTDERAKVAANYFEVIEPGSVIGLVGSRSGQTGRIIDKFSVICSLQDLRLAIPKHRISKLVVASEVDIERLLDECSDHEQLEIIEFEWRTKSLRPAATMTAGSRL